jgi:L-2,4-diaminobutyrate decarboxylase
VSAHKWLFQPKESALVMFRDTARAHATLSFGGDYLACPNIGVLGSHGAAAIPLLATLLAWGREGLATRIEYGMRMADQLAEAIVDTPKLELLALPRTGIVVWRPRDRDGLTRMLAHLPEGTVSTTTLGGERWLRCVAANPNADLDGLVDAVRRAAAS